MTRKVLILGKIHDGGLQMLRDAGGLKLLYPQDGSEQNVFNQDQLKTYPT